MFNEVFPACLAAFGLLGLDGVHLVAHDLLTIRSQIRISLRIQAVVSITRCTRAWHDLEVLRSCQVLVAELLELQALLGDVLGHSFFATGRFVEGAASCLEVDASALASELHGVIWDLHAVCET